MSDEPNQNEVELWQLYGAFWKIPIWVTPISGILKVDITPIRLLSRQKHEALKLISQHGTGEGNIWWLMPKVLELIAEKHEVTKDPELLLVWCPGDSNDRNAFLGADLEAFIKSYCESGSPFPEHVAAGVWYGLCKYALHCLVNLQRPVPMGFCTLYPMQLRSNWCDWLLSKEQPVGLSKHNDGSTKGHNVSYTDNGPYKDSLTRFATGSTAILNRGMAQHMVDGELVAQNEGLAQWSIGVERTAPWFDQVKATETAKLKKYGKKNYWDSVKSTLKRQLPYAIRLYSAFIAEAVLPGVRLPVQSVAGNKITRAALANQAGDRTNPFKSLWSDAHRYDFCKGEPADVPSEISGVLPLSAVLPSETNLRLSDERGDVDQPKDGNR